MIWSAYMGLPRSLESVGAVLGLEEQKLKEGKELIRYFCVPCKPTKANGGRTRNLPVHDPDKWEMFKKYNKRDVETEMAIQKRLANYPVPYFVWDEFHIDQEINDRGIMLDMDVVTNAKVNGRIMERQARRELIEAFLRDLAEMDKDVQEFTDDLWFNLLDHVTVFSKKDVMFTFKNGTEIRVK